MREAEKFGRPILCLVDTQGAFCGTEAEERGQGNAIADNLVAMAGLTVPVVSVLLGEGGSGGALALAVGNRVAMQEHAVYSVLSPEGFASILWKDRTRAPEAAEAMRMDAASVLECGIIDAVISEGEGPAHENPGEAVAAVRDYVRDAYKELADLAPDEFLPANAKSASRSLSVVVSAAHSFARSNLVAVLVAEFRFVRHGWERLGELGLKNRLKRGRKARKGLVSSPFLLLCRMWKSNNSRICPQIERKICWKGQPLTASSRGAPRGSW